jgi:quercetin dioxygenase-like cupin family protein
MFGACRKADAYEKFPAGYGVALHYHTAAQAFWVASGTLEFVTWKTGEKRVLKAGSFVYEPPKTIHRGTCVGPEDCRFFAHSSGSLDIHFVDEKGGEIPPKTN